MLRVIQAFGDHAVGGEITDSAAIEAILESDQAAFVVSVASPEQEAAPEPNLEPEQAPAATKAKQTSTTDSAS